jgi:hypothetical protein
MYSADISEKQCNVPSVSERLGSLPSRTIDVSSASCEILISVLFILMPLISLFF